MNKSQNVQFLEHFEIYSNKKYYCAHPHLRVTKRGIWLLIFNRSPRKPIVLHPPWDFEFQNVLMTSEDEGRTWLSKKRLINGNLTGFECAGLIPFSENGVIINQWRFHWKFPKEIENKKNNKKIFDPNQHKKSLSSSIDLLLNSGLDINKINFKKIFPKVRVGGECLINILHDSYDNSYKTIKVSTHPYAGGYGMRGGIILENNEVFLPLSDVPNYKRIFAIRSTDNGNNWSLSKIIADEKNTEFEEPSVVLLPNGNIFMLLRENISTIIHSIISKDKGISWTKPKKTELEGYPADLLILQEGLLACVTGNRKKPYQILMYTSDDFGETWSDKIVVKNNLINQDLGYPTIAQRKNGEIVIIYYAQNKQLVTSIHQKIIIIE